jgi:hypothetical protein
VKFETASLDQELSFEDIKQPLHQIWPEREGFLCFLHEDEEQRLVFTVDTRDAARNSALIEFTLTNADTGEKVVVGHLLLHDDPENPGHYVGHTQLSKNVTLPERCRIDLRGKKLNPKSEPDRGLLLAAAAAASGPDDRQAWQEWALSAERNRSLPKEVADAICALCASSSSPHSGIEFSVRQKDYYEPMFSELLAQLVSALSLHLEEMKKPPFREHQSVRFLLAVPSERPILDERMVALHNSGVAEKIEKNSLAVKPAHRSTISELYRLGGQ